MLRPSQNRDTNFQSTSPAATLVAVFLFTVIFTLVATQPATAQLLTSVYNFPFTGIDGVYPVAGPIMDTQENLYGTTAYGGIYQHGICDGGGCGVVYKLTRSGSAFIPSTLYRFAGGNDGAISFSSLVFGFDGALYGTTVAGGGGSCNYNNGAASGCGTIFRLDPAEDCNGSLCIGTETVLYRFQGDQDGYFPYASVVFDSEGNLYGTTYQGGAYGVGTVYKLTQTDGQWVHSILYNFEGGNDGAGPIAGLTLDQSGNLYGTTSGGGAGGWGTVFELSPSGGNWNRTTLYSFTGADDGGDPAAGVIFDPAGNLYGATTVLGPAGSSGTAFQLVPSNGSWNFNLLTGFPAYQGGPQSNLTMDTGGNLYGTTYPNAYYQGYGSVFKLARTNNGWMLTPLYVFPGNGSEGGGTFGSVVLDQNGNLFSAAAVSARYGQIFEIRKPGN